MTSQATNARSARPESLPFDAIAVNLVRLAGLPKDKARECEEIVRQVLAAHTEGSSAPAPLGLLEMPTSTEMSQHSRVRRLLESQPGSSLTQSPAESAEDPPAPALLPTSRDRCGSGFEQERPTPPFAPDPTLPTEPRWPETPQDVKDMIGSSFTAAKFVNESGQIGMHSIPAHEMDTYTVTAHDLLEAFANWRDFGDGYEQPAGGSMRGLADWLRTHAEHGFFSPDTRAALKSWATEVEAARRDGDHFVDANDMVNGNTGQPEPTVELHVPVRLSDKQRRKLLDGVCSLVTRHDVPVQRVRIVANYDGLACGRSITPANGAPR